MNILWVNIAARIFLRAFGTAAIHIWSVHWHLRRDRLVAYRTGQRDRNALRRFKKRRKMNAHNDLHEMTIIHFG
jgi:hypothetical protein